jgi:hypothetical protein
MGGVDRPRLYFTGLRRSDVPSEFIVYEDGQRFEQQASVEG